MMMTQEAERTEMGAQFWGSFVQQAEAGDVLIRGNFFYLVIGQRRNRKLNG